ncbi:site-specific integrase [Pontibacter sp. Tf4]|uniref:site-specific integrase n=1 Tax=Pontibacter sp. Tf4 TaxID=2761620 RepID=UPI0016235DD3|nr:site-specific integrase [Pontibacter sp. Tf4]MBB6609997.1 site-specific integrase [Pontibacter sp. Tf4]
MSKRIRIIFYLKKQRNYTTGPVPIYLRITVAGKRAELSTARQCDPLRWNSCAGRATGTRETVLSLNAYLDTLQQNIFEAHRQLLEQGKAVSAEKVKRAYLGKQEKTSTIVEVLETHNQRVETLLGSGYSPATLKGYKTSLHHIKDFLLSKYGIKDLDLKQVDYGFVSDYDFYLRSTCRCSNNSTLKYIKLLKKVIRECLHQGLLDRNPFLHYKGKVKQLERVYLTEEELKKIAAKEMVTERLSQVRDIFLFCCLTGLAYTDVQQLAKENIIKGVDGETWLSVQRQKTGTPTRLPLLPAARIILDRYQQHPQCLYKNRLLPVLSNQKMNAYLKEIMDVCGINKAVTFHTARHTFATTVTLLNGVPMESVCKMLGHTSIKTTQHYAKVLDLKLSQDMLVLRNKYVPEMAVNAAIPSP